MEAATADATEHELDLETDNGVPYVGRLTGKEIASDDTVSVYVTNDERVFVWDRVGQKALRSACSV